MKQQQQNNDKNHSAASVSVSPLGCVSFPWLVLVLLVLVGGLQRCQQRQLVRGKGTGDLFFMQEEQSVRNTTQRNTSASPLAASLALLSRRCSLFNTEPQTYWISAR